jgi:hypothetical protein
MLSHFLITGGRSSSCYIYPFGYADHSDINMLSHSLITVGRSQSHYSYSFGRADHSDLNMLSHSVIKLRRSTSRYNYSFGCADHSEVNMLSHSLLVARKTGRSSSIQLWPSAPPTRSSSSTNRGRRRQQVNAHSVYFQFVLCPWWAFLHWYVQLLDRGPSDSNCAGMGLCELQRQQRH